MMENNTIYFFEPNNKNSKKIISDLKLLFEDLGITAVERSEDARVVASVGGDGAFLQAVKERF